MIVQQRYRLVATGQVLEHGQLEQHFPGHAIAPVLDDETLILMGLQDITGLDCGCGPGDLQQKGS